MIPAAKPLLAIVAVLLVYGVTMGRCSDAPTSAALLPISTAADDLDQGAYSVCRYALRQRLHSSANPQFAARSPLTVQARDGGKRRVVVLYTTTQQVTPVTGVCLLEPAGRDWRVLSLE